MNRLLSLLILCGCSGSSEAPRVDKLVVTESSTLVATNDLGWEIQLDTARVALQNLEFTTEGEAHVATLWQRTVDALIPSAVAHPGHLGGGEVIGELPGTFVADFVGGGELGTATLIQGRYDGANFTFAQHPDLGGGSLELAGSAVKEDTRVDWSATIVQDETRAVVGLPMQVDLARDDVAALRLRFLPTNPTDESETLFDGIDFGQETNLAIGPDTDNGARLLRATQRHDFWDVVAQ